VRGLIAGIGGAVPVPIPHLDDDGRVVGFWSHDEVLQVDRHSLGRPSSGGREAMAGVDPGDLQARIARGTEHLSSLREDYLEQLAAETGLDYLRASTPRAFVRTLTERRYATREPVATRVAWIPAGLSLLCLLSTFAAQLTRAVPRRTGGDAPR
jgi:mxaL protein